MSKKSNRKIKKNLNKKGGNNMDEKGIHFEEEIHLEFLNKSDKYIFEKIEILPRCKNT